MAPISFTLHTELTIIFKLTSWSFCKEIVSTTNVPLITNHHTKKDTLFKMLNSEIMCPDSRFETFKTMPCLVVHIHSE